MAMMNFRYGWLLYANPDLSGGMVVSGDVMQFELSAAQSYGGASVRVTADLFPGGVLRYGQVKGQPPRSLETLMWDALQSWPEPGRKDGRRWPPEMRALLALARAHPEEYERLRDGEAVLKALGGL